MQSKRASLVETLTGTSIGLVGSWLITYSVSICCDAPVSAKTTVIVALCTIWSLVRGYYVRRYFNKQGMQ
jgi:steroid 5-alpha reductase family enzyme